MRRQKLKNPDFRNRLSIDPLHMIISMHNITFVNKANFLKVYNNFVLKWLILALCVVVMPEQILLGGIWRTL